MIFTLGYQLRSQDEFLRTLQEAEVRVLVDVRQIAWSNRREYAKGRLQNALCEAGIEYVHAPFAGNPKEIRRLADSHDDCLSLYEEHVRANPLIVEEFHDLINDLSQNIGSVCLMCYERHPDDCHRSILLDLCQEFTGEEFVVHHLAHGGAPRFRKSPKAQDEGDILARQRD